MSKRARIVGGVLVVVLAAVAYLGVSSGISMSSAAAKATSKPTDPVAALQRAFVRVVDAVRPSVVEIATSSGLGSGVIYDKKGDIVTNAHVVGGAKTFTVTLSNGSQLKGRLVGSFAADDLAVLRVQTSKKLKPAKFVSSSKLKVGAIVLAIGNPLGLSSSVTDGIVSYNGRTLSEGNGVVLADLIQTSAAINPGNSGGALANISGQVVGIPTLAASDGTTAAAGLGFAIPASTVKLIVPQLIAYGKVKTAGRAALGLGGATAMTFAGESIGVVVTDVQAGGPAARAGINDGELITAINGKRTPTYSEMEAVLAELKPGARANVSVTSETGKKRIVSVVLGDLAQG